MARMQAEMTAIADKVRGVAKEKRSSYEQIGALLGVTRQTVGQRMRGEIPWTAPELLVLAVAFEEPITRFYPPLEFGKTWRS